VEIRQGSKLDKLRAELQQQLDLLPPRDLEDRTAIPPWFRVYIRKRYPDLPTSGPYQYPRTATRILQQLLANPDADPESKPAE